MHFLNYELNKQLLAEMKRIYSEFKPENFEIFEYYENKYGELEVWHESEYEMSLERTDRGSQLHPTRVAALTAADLIRFTQLDQTFINISKLQHKEEVGPSIWLRSVTKELVFSYFIFLSAENFEKGAEWLLEELKKIK